jgi:hypothetical protein
VCNFVLLQVCECVNKKLSDRNNLGLTESFALVVFASYKILQIHLGTLHNNVSVPSAHVLVDIHRSYKISVIHDHVLARFRDLFHVGYLSKETLILIIVFDFDLLESIEIIMDESSVHVRISPTNFIHDFDIIELVIAFD